MRAMSASSDSNLDRLERAPHAEMTPSRPKALVALLLILVLGLGAVLLPGCGSDPSKFVGTWEGTSPVTTDEGLTFNGNFTIVISDNGNFTMKGDVTGRWLGINYGTETRGGTWSVKGNTIHLVDTNQESYDLTLSKDGAVLTDEGGTQLYKVR